MGVGCGDGVGGGAVVVVAVCVVCVCGVCVGGWVVGCVWGGVGVGWGVAGVGAGAPPRGVGWGWGWGSGGARAAWAVRGGVCVMGIFCNGDVSVGRPALGGTSLARGELPRHRDGLSAAQLARGSHGGCPRAAGLARPAPSPCSLRCCCAQAAADWSPQSPVWHPLQHLDLSTDFTQFKAYAYSGGGPCLGVVFPVRHAHAL